MIIKKIALVCVTAILAFSSFGIELLIYPNPVLLEKSIDVIIGDKTAVDLLDQMSKKLEEWKAAGLAAPQIGVSKNMLVIDLRENPKKIYKIINPKIITASASMIESHEGCLSLPFLWRTILRNEKITLEYLDENFKKRKLTATGFLSCCLQHEMDHLRGVLYIDYLPESKRAQTVEIFNQKMTEFETNGTANDDDDAIQQAKTVTLNTKKHKIKNAKIFMKMKIPAIPHHEQKLYHYKRKVYFLIASSLCIIKTHDWKLNSSPQQV